MDAPGGDLLRDAGLWRAVFDASPDAVLLIDAEGAIVAANGHCEDVFGHRPEDLVGRPVEVLVPEASRRGHPRRRESFDAVHGGRPMGLLPLAATRADGTVFPAEISLARVSAEGATYTCATVRDITARVLQEERFRGLLEAAPDAMVIVDGDGRIVLVNRQVVNLFGYEPDELLGEPVEVLVPDRLREGHGLLRGGFLGEPGTRSMGSGRELYAARKDGTEFPVEISLSPLLTDEGMLVSAAVRDISERVRLQHESDRVRDELVATVSHELRTPLTSIIGYVELLRDLEEDSLGPDARRMLGVIERNASRELTLVNDLLDLSAIDAQVSTARHDPVALDGLVRSAVEGARLAARTRGISITAAVAGDREALAVRGDARRLAQVLDNLVANAVKFTAPGGEVTLAAGREGEVAWVEVRDTGAGIPEAELPRIFDRLFRASDAVREQVPGAGLGLAIAKAIVEAHGGTISARSVVGSGTTIRFELPAGPEGAAAGATG